jgi:hypothetical protein
MLILNASWTLLLRHPKSKRAAAAEGHASSTKGGPKEGSSGQDGAQPTKQSTERLNVLAMDLGLTSAEEYAISD